MAGKSKKAARKAHRAQKSRAAEHAKAQPPGPVTMECRDESGRTIPAVCYPPDPRYVLEGRRWRQRYYAPRWSDARARWMGVDQSKSRDRSAVVVIDGATGEILAMATDR